jgi:predicted AlkP superfamily phosphohydrolase/phosphomutase
MDVVIEFAKLIIPAALVLYGMYLAIKSFTTKELEKILLESRTRSTEVVQPIRLQAYERICILLERMSPNNMVVRLNDNKMTARQLQSLMLAEIREEFNHNVSQQIYMSEEAWSNVRTAKEDLITIINTSADNLGDDAMGIDLAKGIFQELMSKPRDPINEALIFLKEEIRQIF